MTMIPNPNMHGVWYCLNEIDKNLKKCQLSHRARIQLIVKIKLIYKRARSTKINDLDKKCSKLLERSGSLEKLK